MMLLDYFGVLVGLEPTWELFSVMLLDYFGFLVGFMEKGNEISKSRQISGSYAAA